MIIAIDGPAASGKGTISKGLAKHYDLAHLDTGLLYRAVAFAMGESINNDGFEAKAIKIAKSIDKNILNPDILNLDILGTPQIASGAAKIAKIEQVRAALRQYQINFSKADNGAILDGRDIGTRICPNASVKLFITADASVRAKRRTLQLLGKGLAADESDILAQIIARDKSDTNNKAGNFYKASDAHLLDTTNLDIESSLRKAIAIVETVIANGSEE